MIETNATLAASMGDVFTEVKTHVQTTMMKVRIFYETKSVEDIGESKKYNFSSIVSALGGAISLYLGVSMVSIFEIFDVMIHGIVYSTGKKW